MSIRSAHISTVEGQNSKFYVILISFFELSECFHFSLLGGKMCVKGLRFLKCCWQPQRTEPHASFLLLNTCVSVGLWNIFHTFGLNKNPLFELNTSVLHAVLPGPWHCPRDDLLLYLVMMEENKWAVNGLWHNYTFRGKLKNVFFN